MRIFAPFARAWEKGFAYNRNPLQPPGVRVRCKFDANHRRHGKTSPFTGTRVGRGFFFNVEFESRTRVQHPILRSERTIETRIGNSGNEGTQITHKEVTRMAINVTRVTVARGSARGRLNGELVLAAVFGIPRFPSAATPQRTAARPCATNVSSVVLRGFLHS